MKPAPFGYVAAQSVAEAVALLCEFGEDAKVLAGGQSLVPMMNFRLARPEILVDVNPVTALAYVAGCEEPEVAGGSPLRIGALARTRALEDTVALNGRWAVLPAAARRVGHRPIRVRGTVGGSIAHADPAAELPAVAVALDAELICAGPGGERTVGARDFFRGTFETALAADELLQEIRLPAPPASAGSAVVEYARRAGDFAIVLAVALVAVSEGRCVWARLALGGVDSVPVVVADVAPLLEGQEPSVELFAAAGHAVSRAIDPGGDLHASSDYRRHLARVLTERALADAVRRSPGFTDASGLG